jgi:hypothetical protein
LEKAKVADISSNRFSNPARFWESVLKRYSTMLVAEIQDGGIIQDGEKLNLIYLIWILQQIMTYNNLRSWNGKLYFGSTFAKWHPEKNQNGGDIADGNT